jgi:conjugative transfer signal peptidase TraF
MNFIKSIILHFKPKQKHPFWIVISVVVVVFTTHYFGILINVTPSMKLGFYGKSTSLIHRGDTVAFFLADPYKTIGLDKLYIEKGRKCNGADPLIKEVIAIPGDHVILNNDTIQVNGAQYFYRTSHMDSEGRALDIYPRGDYPNTTGYWMLGTYGGNSWDSRYWGPIPRDRILYKVIPLLTW